MKIIQAEFIKSAFQPADYPPERLPEAGFAGKSNVGKSSLINTLLNRKNLARTSSTPGRTQSLNFFSINERLSFVDLPGYGFAKVPRQIQQQWKPMVESYLKSRKSLKLVVLILDIRRAPSKDDYDLVEWLTHYRIPFVVVLTKADKVSRSQRSVQKTEARRALELEEHQLILFSALTGEGKEALWRTLSAHLKP